MTRQRTVRATARTVIDAPPAVVYTWVTSPDLVVSWVKDLMESRPVSSDAPLAVGARSVEVIRVGGKLLEVPAQVTALDPGRVIENRLDLPEGAATSRIDIAALSAGCSVTQAMEAVFAGMRLVPSSLLARLLEQRLRGDLRRLKKVVESR